MFYIESVFLYKRRLYFIYLFFNFSRSKESARRNKCHVLRYKQRACNWTSVIYCFDPLLIKRKLAPSHSFLCQYLLYCCVHSFCINICFSTTLFFSVFVPSIVIHSALAIPYSLVPILFASTLVCAALLLSFFVFVNTYVRCPRIPFFISAIVFLPCPFIFIIVHSFLSQSCFSSMKRQ